MGGVEINFDFCEEVLEFSQLQELDRLENMNCDGQTLELEISDRTLIWRD